MKHEKPQLVSGKTSKFSGLALLALCLVPAVLMMLLFTESEFEFTDLPNVPGFRTLASDERPASFNPLQVHLSQRPDEHSGELNICKALSRAKWGTAAGNLDAPVTIVEFSDYRCPYCKVLSEILSRMRAEKNIRLIHKEWPILGEPSLLAARAALAAGKQSSYEAFHRKLMQTGFLPNMTYIKDLAQRLNLDQSLLLEDMQSEDVENVLKDNRALAARLGLSGTPALVVGRTIVSGAISESDLERLVELESSLSPVCG